MVVKVFCGEEFEYEHEWNQLKELYDVIYEIYTNSDENVYILSNFDLAKVQIDVFILTENGTAILDLKSYDGKIIGNENGDWIAIKNGKKIPLHKNLFRQLRAQKFDLMEKLNQIRIGNFEHIEERNLGLIKCWGYFEKGSSYDIAQIGESAHIWFDVITADNLIEKMKWINAQYKLKMRDMDAIVKGLNLKEYSIGKKSPVKSAFESNYEKELSVFIQPNNWDEILRKTSESNIITIVGEPRVGKSTSIINVANKLKNEGYKIQEDKESLIELFRSRDDKKHKLFLELINDRNAFILDDVFGAIEYEPGLANIWVPFIIKILNYSNINSKFIFSSRTDVFDNFLSSNNELSYTGLKNVFDDSIVKLNFSNYSNEIRKQIFNTNLEYIKFKEGTKKSVLIENNEKIINELLLPGEIWHFLGNAKDDEFQEYQIDNLIEKAKRQVNFIKEQIISLDDHEKLFLYNLYINQDFDIDDLKDIYSYCLPPELYISDYFKKFSDKFKNRFIRIKVETGLYSNDSKSDISYINLDGITKLEFIHPIYIEAINKLIRVDEEERRVFENILEKLYNSIPIANISITNIPNWKFNSNNYDHLRFNIFKIILKHYDLFNFNVNDLIIRTLSNLSYSFWDRGYISSLELESNGRFDSWNSSYSSICYISNLYNNYFELDDDLKEYINSMFKDTDSHEAIAYCFAYGLNIKIIQKLQDKLKELSISDEVKSLIAKCIIKNYEYLSEDNQNLLFKLELKNTLLIQYLINNFNKISKELKTLLITQIEATSEGELIETGATFLINYSSLPSEIKTKYGFMFNLTDELIFMQIGRAFTEWFAGTFTDLDYDSKYEKIEQNVLDLYCMWLKNKMLMFSINIEELENLLSNIYGEFCLYGNLEYSIFCYNNLNLAKPKWTEPFFSKLKEALEANMIIVLDLFSFKSIKVGIYNTGFSFLLWSNNKELIEKISHNILIEKDDIKKMFLEDCRDKEILYKIKKSQMNILEELSMENNLEIRTLAKEKLDYIDRLFNENIIQIGD